MAVSTRVRTEKRGNILVVNIESQPRDWVILNGIVNLTSEREGGGNLPAWSFSGLTPPVTRRDFFIS